MIVNFFYEIIITRLKRMFCVYRLKRCQEGLLNVVLVLFLSLVFSACGDSDSRKNDRDGTAERIFKGTVREIVGEVQLKTFDGESNRLEVGQKIFEKNKVVVEPNASVVISVSDGSALMVDGKSEVELDAIVLESLRRKIAISVRHGRLMFDIQKQTVKDEFEFRTDNLVSTVRGAAGFVENVDGLEISSLKDGGLDVVRENDSPMTLTSGQTLLANDNGVRVISLSSSGTLILARAIDSIANEASSQLGIRASRLALDQLEKMLQTYDDVYKKKIENFVKKTRPQFKPSPLNEYIGKPEATLEASFVPGTFVIVLGIRDSIPESGLYKHTFEWEDSTAYGAKRFIVNCSNGDVEYICHTWNTNFVSAKMAEILTKANERKAVAVKDSSQQSKKLKKSIAIEGSVRERIHVLPEERDIPATLRFSVTGLAGADLKQIKKIVVKRKKTVIKTFSGDELLTNSFKVPLRLKQNRIARIEITAFLAKGKKIKAKKIYETYCYFDNYEGGKKSNRVNDMSAEEEYKNVVAKHLLKNE
ncbi:MAG: FecR domain-containing protein [Fibrobacter sp.]|nr:FecR domain-containing protein [Fibrobacter sp.]